MRASVTYSHTTHTPTLKVTTLTPSITLSHTLRKPDPHSQVILTHIPTLTLLHPDDRKSRTLTLTLIFTATLKLTTLTTLAPSLAPLPSPSSWSQIVRKHSKSATKPPLIVKMDELCGAICRYNYPFLVSGTISLTLTLTFAVS